MQQDPRVVTTTHDAFGDEAAISHDARNSIATLRLLVEGVHDGVLDATPESGVIEQMLLHVRLLSDLLGQRHQGAAVRAGAAIAHPVSIGGLLEQWSEAMRPKATARRVELRVSVAPGLPEVECRVGHMSRVLLNLIDNAVRCSPAGGMVMVRCVAHPGGVQVQINDGGPGLPDAVRTGVLEPARAPRAGAAGRMGLVIARSIVEAHGGTLWAASPPRGASLRFYLPATAGVSC